MCVAADVRFSGASARVCELLLGQFCETAEFREGDLLRYAGFSTAAFSADASFSGVAFEQLSWFMRPSKPGRFAGATLWALQISAVCLREDPAILRS